MFPVGFHAVGPYLHLEVEIDPEGKRWFGPTFRNYKTMPMLLGHLLMNKGQSYAQSNQAP